MIESVYLLCVLTSLLCAVLLWRGYRHQHLRLLLWGALCFVGFAVSNAAVFLDMVVYPQYDLSYFRILPSLIGALGLMYGLIMEGD